MHFQIFGTSATNIYPYYKELINLLNDSATQQMLIYRATGTNTYVNNTFLDGDYRNMVTFNPGDPQPAYRFIATSLGSQCGHALFNPGGTFINTGAGVGAGIIARLFFFRIPIVAYNLGVDAEAYALPASGVQKIARLYAVNNFKLFGFINIFKQLYDNTAYSSGTQLPIDGAPGATYPLIDVQALQQLSEIPHIPPIELYVEFPIFSVFGAYFDIYAHNAGFNPQFCFVPTASALDINPFNAAALSAPYVDGYNADFPSKSDTYIAQEAFSSGSQTVYNNAHIRFTARNAQWMYDQMEGISDTLNCSSECSPDNNFSIQGDNDLCSSNIYSISNGPSNINVTWSATPSGIVSLSPNGSQVTVTKITSGSVTLKATISNSCISPVQIQKQIQVFTNPSISQINIEENGPSCIAGQSLSFGTTYNGDYGCSLSNDGITEVDWQIMSPQPYQVTYNAGFYECSSGSVINPGISLHFSPPTTPFMLTLRARVENKCGEWSNWSPGYLFQISGCSPSPDLFSITPNPASETITIASNPINEEYVKVGGAKNSGFIKEVKIYTSSGKIINQQQFSGNPVQVQMSIAKLANGIYFVEISDGKYTETQKLVINR